MRSSSGPAVSLDAVHAEDWVQIRCILFEQVRERCGAVGVREGEVVRCRESTAEVLRLQTEDGRVLEVAREWARFIEVAPLELAVA